MAPQQTAAGSVTVENCGQSITFNQPPQRVVGYYQHPTELLVGLGVQDRIVGTVYPDNDPLPQYADAYRAIPKISDKDASFEQLLARQPDLVYGGYNTAFDEKAGRSRKAYADVGIAT
ncbi:ABC transporter substrate-binding protein [Actinokineospora sp. HUAS TT18]|uniref:ABC transporter substrate-binding protein n=1 Tax=Actinokineospora sp. HUAS TT18 TaxID=3447451 RepID=UPI003F52468D